MFHLRGLARLRDELKLDAQQEALWKETRDFVREQRDAMRERSRREYAETRTLLDQPGADLRAVVKRMDELRSESLKQHEAVRERCLAVYDSLSAEQKEKVRLFFKAGMERGGKDGKRPGRGHPRQDKRQRHAPAPARE
jgi:Spy/CpxP family protein refolding chaperone